MFGDFFSISHKNNHIFSRHRDARAGLRSVPAVWPKPASTRPCCVCVVLRSMDAYPQDRQHIRLHSVAAFHAPPTCLRRPERVVCVPQITVRPFAREWDCNLCAQVRGLTRSWRAFWPSVGGQRSNPLSVRWRRTRSADVLLHARDQTLRDLMMYGYAGLGFIGHVAFAGTGAQGSWPPTPCAFAEYHLRNGFRGACVGFPISTCDCSPRLLPDEDEVATPLDQLLQKGCCLRLLRGCVGLACRYTCTLLEVPMVCHTAWPVAHVLLSSAALTSSASRKADGTGSWRLRGHALRSWKGLLCSRSSYVHRCLCSSQRAPIGHVLCPLRWRFPHHSVIFRADGTCVQGKVAVSGQWNRLWFRLLVWRRPASSSSSLFCVCRFGCARAFSGFLACWLAVLLARFVRCSVHSLPGLFVSGDLRVELWLAVPALVSFSCVLGCLFVVSSFNMAPPPFVPSQLWLAR